MPRIFEPFFTTKEVGKGTGLGLATVYGIIKQHEGWIDVQTELGRGTKFRVFFPAETSKARKAEALPANVLPLRTTGTETILLVEDESVLRDMARTILEECGYRVIDASTGVEALAMWNREMDKIDLVVTDMVMPDGMSGMDLAKRLVGMKPGTRIIFASGYSMDDLDTDFVRRGYAGFLQKPYTHLTLSKAVRECLDKPAVLNETCAAAHI